MGRSHTVTASRPPLTPSHLLFAAVCLALVPACASKGGRAPSGKGQEHHATRTAAAPDAQSAPQLGASADIGDNFDWTGELATGQTLQILNVNGGIQVEQGTESSSSAHVTATIEGRGKHADLDGYRVRVETHRDGIVVCALQPEWPDDCSRRHHGKKTVGDDVQIEFHATLPPSTHVKAESINGGIDVGTMDGRVSATTVNGTIQVAAADTAALQTVNGAIRAHLTDGAGSSLETVNGALRLSLPPDANVSVEGRTVNGGIDSDFPLTVEGGRFGPPRRIRGTIGDGGSGGELALQTVNGSISIRKGRP